MEEIGKNTYLDDSYAGVVLAVIKLNRGLLIVDSPMRPADQQSWRRRLDQFGKPNDRFTLMLDAHIDRTIGLHASGGSILGHENAVEIIGNRSASLRPQDIEAGAEAETLDLPVNVRWDHPDMTFSYKMDFYTNETPVSIIHRPGAHLAGCWVCLDAEKIIFVGDSVLAYQPPFLAWADLETWLDELAELQSERLKDFRIVSGRNGLVRRKTVERLADFLTHVKNLLPDLAAQEDKKDAIEELLPGLLRKVSFNKKNLGLYRKRLAYGLRETLKRHEALKNKEE